MKAAREGVIGWLMYGGCVTSIVVGLLTYFLAFGAAVGGVGRAADGLVVLGAAVAVLAAVLSLVGLAGGLFSERNLHRGPVRVVPSARVVARYALDRLDVLFTDEFDIEMLEKPRYYVRLDLGDGDNAEYECAAPVFWSAGEGMRGRATVQGQWMSQFEPLMGVAEASDPRAYR